jgi:hypothetical protein
MHLECAAEHDKYKPIGAAGGFIVLVIIAIYIYFHYIRDDTASQTTPEASPTAFANTPGPPGPARTPYAGPLPSADAAWSQWTEAVRHGWMATYP